MSEVVGEKVLLDVESTLANTNGAFLERYNYAHGTDYMLSDIDSWEWVETEVNFADFMSIVESAWEDYETMDTTESGLGDTVSNLTQEYEVHIVTARQGVESYMQRWLDSQNVCSHSQFMSVNPNRCKSELDFRIYVDDNPRLAENLADGEVQYMPKHPWNESHWDHPRVEAVETVREAAERLTEDN